MSDLDELESGSESGTMDEDLDGSAYGSDAGDYEYDDGSVDLPMQSGSKAAYVILDLDRVQERQDAMVARTAELCCMSSGAATRVLRAFRWDASKLQDVWFTDPERVKKQVGLLDEQPSTARSQARCGICFDVYPTLDMHAAACKHYFCSSCWGGYIHMAVESGPACLDLRCPEPGCSALVPRSIASAVMDAAHKARWSKYALDSFVEDQSSLTWCPAPDCTRVAEATSAPVTSALDVMCTCGAKYCFKCKEEAHRPVNCEIVKSWMTKNSAEKENMEWIIANTKSCPNCKKPIEKNQGCMHMTCSQCKCEFCWLCLGSWDKHSERTGGYYTCNIYKSAQENKDVTALEKIREQARKSLERYMHYWQRWAENDRAKTQAVNHLAKFRHHQQEPLSEITATPTSQLKFVENAWEQVIDCRRILKWTYAEGFYKFATKGDELPTEAAKQHEEFFVFNQGQAEFYLEKLHHKVEKELQTFLQSDSGPHTSNNWAIFRANLIGLTDATRLHFTKLVDEMEKGLDVALNSYGSADAQGPSSSAPLLQEPEEGASGVATRASTKRLRGRAAGASAVDDRHSWLCEVCTYANTHMSSRQCQRCGHSRR